MATPGQAMRQREHYERLSDFYLRLWKQLDLVCGDANWLQVGPVSQAELRHEAEAILQDIERWLTASPLADDSVLRQDFRKTQDLLDQGNQAAGGSCAFRDYLRDLALRYSQLALRDSLPRPA